MFGIAVVLGAGTAQAQAPGTPTSFQAGVQWSGGNPFVVLQWNAGAGAAATGFVLQREVSGSNTYQRLTALNGSTLSFNDYWIQPNTGYSYQIAAFNTSGTSPFATVTFPATQSVPLGYVSWSQSQWPATGGALAPAGLWTSVGTDGIANSILYAFSGNPALNDAPGALSILPAASNMLEVWGVPFTAQIDTHYQLQGSPDLVTWQKYLDETSAPFAQIGDGSGPSVALLSVNPSAPSAPHFFRWSISPNTSASATPTGMLVNGLAGSSNATLTQKNPVFSWEMGNGMQTAYEILVATSPSLLTEGTANVWSSGKITGTGSIDIPYAGLALGNNTTYYWTVRVWNGSGAVSTFAPAQTFMTGTLTSTYQTNPPKLVEDSIAPVQFVKKGTGWYFIDFGKDAFGTVTVNIPTPVANQVFTVKMGEDISNATTVNTSPGATIRYQLVSVTMQAGVTTYTLTVSQAGSPVQQSTYVGSIKAVTPFRYVEITNVPEPFAASQINQLAIHVPWDDSAATFTSSDALLNSIWALCKYTTKATTFEGTYVDGDRERTPYEADSYIHMLNHYYLDRDYVTPRYSHEYLLTHPQWPTEWRMHSIFMAWADYLYSGDTRSLQANYAVLQGKLPAAALIRSDGLYTGSTTSGSGAFPTDIVDWPSGERDNYTMGDPVKTVTSAFLYQSEMLMSQIATVLGHTSDATTYQSAATLTLNSINSKLWDSTNNRYVDGLTSAGVADTHASLHGNMFPLAFGIVPANRQASVVSYLETHSGITTPAILCSPYGAQYLFDALYSAGQGNYALSLFNSTGIRSWYNMMQAGAMHEGSTMTMEAWDLSLKSNLDWNHAWGSAAANIIPRWLMGVRPLTPGYQTFVIQPQLGTLSYASITVPTIRGTIGVNVQTNTSTDFSMSVTIPANTSANVGLPTLGGTDTTVYVDGTISAGTISGNTIWVNNVTPGPHLFERLP